MRRSVSLALAGVLLGGILAVARGPSTAAAASCPPSPFTAAFDRDVRARWPSNRITAAVHDTRTGCEYHYRPGVRVTTASVVKLEVLAGVLLRAQNEGRAPTAWEHDRLWPMVTQSANPPTTELYGSLGGSSGFARLNAVFGLGETDAAPPVWGLTATTARDQVRLVRQVLVGGGPLEGGSRLRAWHYLGNVVPSQRWGTGEGLPPGYQVGLKNGFAPSDCCGWRINTAGYVSDEAGKGWAVTILTDGWPSEAAGREAMSYVATRVNGSLAGSQGARCAASSNPPRSPSTTSARGVWIATSDGGVRAYGVPFHGSPFGAGARSRPLSIDATPSGNGYWVLGGDGSVYAFGGARHHGGLYGARLHAPVIDLEPTRSGRGYWILAADGGVFSFGDARFHGSTGGMRLNAPVRSLSVTPSGRGYWLLATDGGVFSFGDADFHGSTGGMRLREPVVDLEPTRGGGGYWLVGGDGGIFAFGRAPYHGSIPGTGRCWSPVTRAIRRTAGGAGYWILTANGQLWAFGDARHLGPGTGPRWPAIPSAVDAAVRR